MYPHVLHIIIGIYTNRKIGIAKINPKNKIAKTPMQQTGQLFLKMHLQAKSKTKGIMKGTIKIRKKGKNMIRTIK